MIARWKQFSALIPAIALVFLDQSIMPVALPTLQKEMLASDTALQWCVNSYLLAIAMFVLIAGKWGDRAGHKKMLFGGVLGFILSSILCSLSPSIYALIAARFLQGMSASCMFPAQTTMIALIFPPEKRGKAMGLITSSGSLFFILGPMVGGYLVEALSWRWIFWINVPIGAFGLWMIHSFLPSSERGRGKIDLLSFCFFIVAISSLTLVFMQATDWGWESFSTLFFASLALIGLLLLLYREKKIPHPFLDLSLFKHSIFTALNVTISTIQFFIMISVFRTIYLQDILHYTPLVTGLLMMFAGLPLLFVAPLAGMLSDRFTPKLPITLGYLCLVISCFWLGFVPTPSLTLLAVLLFAFGAGTPLVFTPSYSSAISSVPRSKVGVASGIIVTSRMTSGTIGLALIHLFVSVVQRDHLAQGARIAEIISFAYIHFALGGFLIFMFLITFWLHKRHSAHQLPKGPAEGWD